MSAELSERDYRLAALRLEWSRSIEQHRLSWEEWLVRKAAALRSSRSAIPKEARHAATV